MIRRPLGRTGLEVTPICVGSSPLAIMPGLYGYSVAHARAGATIAAVLDGPLNFIDTSNNYGDGNAEERIGAVLRARGRRPAGRCRGGHQGRRRPSHGQLLRRAGLPIG